MKKLLAVLLAVMMVLSMSVMAFAAFEGAEGITDQNPETAVTDGKTDLMTLTEDEDGNDLSGGVYTVTIPATVEIPWFGTTAGDTFEWSYDAQLAAGYRLTLGVASGKTGTFATTDKGSLTYALSGTGIDANYTTASEVEADTFTATVTTEGWDNVPIANYTQPVTFTASVALAA